MDPAAIRALLEAVARNDRTVDEDLARLDLAGLPGDAPKGVPLVLGIAKGAVPLRDVDDLPNNVPALCDTRWICTRRRNL